jgi:mannitol/fructose-specific phosphotransferase system IIA component (Ntr-type)
MLPAVVATDLMVQLETATGFGSTIDPQPALPHANPVFRHQKTIVIGTCDNIKSVTPVKIPTQIPRVHLM